MCQQLDVCGQGKCLCARRLCAHVCGVEGVSVVEDVFGVEGEYMAFPVVCCQSLSAYLAPQSV